MFKLKPDVVKTAVSPVLGAKRFVWFIIWFNRTEPSLFSVETLTGIHTNNAVPLPPWPITISATVLLPSNVCKEGQYIRTSPTFKSIPLIFAGVLELES